MQRWLDNQWFGSKLLKDGPAPPEDTAMNHRIVLAYAAILLAAPATWADEAHLIKPDPEPEVGRRTRFIETVTDNSRKTLTDAAGKLVEETKESLERTVVVEQTIVALKAGTKLPSMLVMKFEKFKCKRNGEAVEYGLDGKTVVAELKDEEYALSIKGGGKILDGALEMMKEELREWYLEKEEDWLRVLPTKAVRVGETWSCNVKAIAEDSEKLDGFKIDVAKAKGTGKLLKASQKNGRTFGEFEIALDLPVREFTDFDGVQVKVQAGSKHKMTYSYAGCIDGSLDEGVETITMEMILKYSPPEMKGATSQWSHTSKSVTERKEVRSK
jgi:hypothetical protein